MVRHSTGPATQALATVQPGTKLPDFSLENQYGERVTSQDLSTGRSIIVFYPWAFSRVCGGELAELQQHLPEFRDANVRLVAISVDHKFALRTYAEQEGFEFELLADFWPHGHVAELFDAFDAERGVARRVTIHVHNGVITDRFASGISEPRKLDQYRQILSQRDIF